MAPTVEEALPEKKKTGIRRLLSPAIFSHENPKRRDTPPAVIVKRKTINGCSKDAASGGRTSVETAFVGNDTSTTTTTTTTTANSTASVSRYRSSDVKLTRKKRSKSLSPVRPKGTSTTAVDGSKSRKTRTRDGLAANNNNNNNNNNNECRRDERKDATGRKSNGTKDVCRIPKAVSPPPVVTVNGKEELPKSTWSPYSYRTEAVAKQSREKQLKKGQNVSTRVADSDNSKVATQQPNTPNGGDDGSSSVSSSPTLTPDDNGPIRSETDDQSYETMSSSYESMPSSSPARLPSGRTSAPPVVVPYSQYYNKPSSARYQQMYIDHSGSNHRNNNNYYGGNSVQRCSKEMPLTNGGGGGIPVLTKVQHDGLRLVRPQPIYNGDLTAGSEQHYINNAQRRPRSISPTTALKRDDSYFVRGSAIRSTIGAYRLERSTVYEMIPSQRNLSSSSVRRKLLEASTSKTVSDALNAASTPPPPIFKRGALTPSSTAAGEVSPPSSSSGSSATPTKKVSFSPSHEADSNHQIYWPTRKGMAPEPPTRQSSSKLSSSKFQIPPPPAHPLCGNEQSASNSAYVNVAPTTIDKSSISSKLSSCQLSSSASNTNSGRGVKVVKLQHSESESGSEAGEVQRIFQNSGRDYGLRRQSDYSEEDWNGSNDVKNRTGPEQSGGNRQEDEHKKGGRAANRRDDPRRHTLSGDHTMVNSTQYRPANSVSRSMDLEMGFRTQRRKMPSARGYPIPSNSLLFDDDPGIMSEAETSSTGFRRGNKQRSSLPVVRTPSKTLERPLGLVFLQYRNETKKSLLPNEITSLDTVKALFVRSFPKQLTMDYLDTPGIKIYIHDAQKNMFYELEDSRLHLNEIRGGSILRLYDYTHGPLPPNFTSHPGIWEQDQSYFSEPEFDSEFEHQHIHKSKINKSGAAHQQSYYMTHSFPPGSSSTVPRGGPLLRPYSPGMSHATASKQHPGFMSSPERAAAPPPRGYNPYRLYEDPYYAQFAAARSNSITPIIDEETSEAELLDESFNLYGGNVKIPVASPRSNPYSMPAPTAAGPQPTFDNTRLRVEHMERQLANLTGLVQKALTHTPTSSPREREFSASSDDSFTHSEPKPPKLGKDKSVSFEKSVSFSDDPPDMNSPKQHSPQHTADSKPTKPAIKSSTLPRTSSQERERLKPVPPPKPLNLSTVSYDGRTIYRDMQLTPEMYNQLRGLQKRAKDLRQDLRNLRRISQAQTHAIKETIKDTFIKIRSVILSGGENLWCGNANSDRIRVQREEDLYKQEMIRLENDLTELECTVEELRGNVINRKSRVNMSDVENMALILSKSSKTVADLKLRFPNLQNDLKTVVTQELDRVVIVESFLKEEPDRLESALKRCKKLTGTLVTLKRLASVQEQRLPDVRLSPTADETPPITPTSGKIDGPRSIVGQPVISGGYDNGATSAGRIGGGNESGVSAENTLDSLLEELKTFSKLPISQNLPNNLHNIGSITAISTVTTTTTTFATTGGTLRRLNSFPSTSSSSNCSLSIDKPPVPERHSELSNKRVPPPPPPRTSSKSPLASPTNVNAPVRSLSLTSPTRKNSLSAIPKLLKDKIDSSTASSSSCESINSQEGVQSGPLATTQSRQEQLEIRHQELLRKQKALQEQYTRLQQLQRGAGGVTPSVTAGSADLMQLKKTGSESNLIGKLGLGFSTVNTANTISGSLSQLNPNSNPPQTINATSSSSLTIAATTAANNNNNNNSSSTAPTENAGSTQSNNNNNNKVYETDIL